MTIAKRPGRGRPRSETARQRVLTAARELMVDGGVAAVTIEALAVRSGVTRPTIYRSWPNATAVAMAALMEQPAREMPSRPRSSLAASLESELAGLIRAFATPMGRSAMALVASADPSTELAKAFRHQLLLRTRARVRDALETAAANGALRSGVDLDVAADLVMAPVFFRLLLGHAPLSPAFAKSVVKQLFDGLAIDKA